MAPPHLLLFIIIFVSFVSHSFIGNPQPLMAVEWMAMIAVAGTIAAGFFSYMNQRDKGNYDGAAGHTNTVRMISSKMESVRSEGNDRDSLTSITSEYDVFLSFRGPDARYGIVDHLYECMTSAGLHVFKDDEEIRPGEEIRGELLRAITSSRVYAVVLSRNYASSVWCLRELNMMVDLQGGSNIGRKIILPIFYGADPADVKLQTELYREALKTHKVRHGDDVVKKWEEALMTVGRISGWDSKAFQGEGRFVRLIVQDILGKLRLKDQNLPVHLTGINDRVTDMVNLLDCDSMGLRLVVLHGMGGIGKTTLACFIFNELCSMFEGSSFISNIRESFTGHGGIANLMNKLSRDILGGQYARSCNSGDEFNEIIPRIRGKRILLVLDDVDEPSQLKKLIGNNPEDTLGTGSRVIITTRNKTVFNDFVRLDSEVLQFYEMEKMHDNHALQLFSRHAFGIDEPPEDYVSLSKQVVETTGNLPLALEVIAGQLCCQSKESWMYTLEKLKNVPPKEVFEILKVSYMGLDFREREIFLDIACFQPEMPQRYAYYLWKARKLYPETAVKVLINRSLIKISSNGEFWIHDQLRDMGREIIRSEGLGSPDMCTRLWDPDDALKIMLQKEVSKKIIAMKFGSYDQAHKFSYKNFRGLSNLLYLHLDPMQLIGDFGDLREKLMWLSWRNCNKKLNSDFFKMTNLVVLKIQSFIGEWRGEEKMIAPNLRVLEIREGYMMTTPDVSCCLKLEIMVFESVRYLKEIHPSVGGLVNLTYLKIADSEYLGSLPKELCCARALQELTVTKTSIEEVPESFGRLESLRTLNLRDNKIRTLPTSIRYLKKLLVLDAGINPLDKGIPEEIGSISALEHLDLSCSMLPFLPETVGQLSSLKSLKINNCGKLEELPRLPTSLTVLFASSCPLNKGIHEENGNLLVLENMDLSRSRIRFLPASVSRLSSLKTLKLQNCNMLREFPRLPTSLTVLSATHCPLYEGISEEIGSLLALENLNLSGCQIRFLPATISRLSSLSSLNLDGCDMLRELPELPTSLTELIFSSKSLRALPNFAVMTNITVLKLSDGIDCTEDPEGERLELSGLGRLENLKSLVLSKMITFTRSSELGSLSKLETLYLSFPDMTSVPELPSSLRKLTILHLRTSIPWERYSNLRLLTELELIGFKITDIELGGLDSLPRLMTLSIEDSDSLLGVSNLGRLRGLKSLKFGSCGALVEIPGLEQLQQLEELSIIGCNSICEIPDLLAFQRLKKVRICNCSSWLCVPRMMDDCCLDIWSCGTLPTYFGTYSGYKRKTEGQEMR